MAKPIFPSRRFRGIGATREEVDEMEQAFARSDLIVQRDFVDHFKSMSAAALRAYLAGWREAHAEDTAGSGQSEPPEIASPTGASGGLSEASSDDEPDDDLDDDQPSEDPPGEE